MLCDGFDGVEHLYTATILTVAELFQFDTSLAFSPASASEVLRDLPSLPGVVALRGPSTPGHAEAEPYLTRTADLRRRISRILAPAEPSADGTPVRSKRLNLRDRVVRIDYTVTGSEFESTLALYHAAAGIFGFVEARRRLRLHTPFLVRFMAENAHPRVYSTNRLSRRALAQTYGPFPSRLATERYIDSVLDLFKLRRCYEDLAPYPDHPGCVYQEMKKCLAPCNQAHTPEGAAAYTAEASAVKRFFDTQGESMIVDIGLEREDASAAMEFERAAALHAQWQKVKAAQALADELIRPVPGLRAIIVQPAAKLDKTQTDQAAVFLLGAGCLTGPERLSTLGVRAVKEQTSVGSSLFAQPLMLQAVPLEGEVTPTESPELRGANLIASLESKASPASDLALLSDHLSLLRRWYYRPEKQRTGEIFFPNADGSWPIRRILRGAARMALGEPAPMAETQRELAERNPADAEQRPVRTKILHEGRPDVERVVHVIDGPVARTFTSRRRSSS